MHISELRLVGFKSFVDPVRAPIEAGLTGVVGPNGCGKSNLLESVRWVMGANSAKAMRAQDMEDVIFSGSAGRPTREHAEVTLVLNDAAGRAPAPFTKDDTLEVSRRIRRGLGSTYRINGKEVRAKDVQLLFADAATGANSPALVRQGQVSELIAAKPENRRRILEDAAGVAGLHARRHEADLKLRAAEANLTRLDEILAEIDAQAQSLKKQARQAERYRGLAQTLRETEALLLHRRWTEARAALEDANARLRETERAAAETAAEASAADRAAEAAREAIGPLREEEMVAAAVLRRLEGVRVGLERDLAEAEAQIARIDAEARRGGEERERLDALRVDAEGAMKRLAEENLALGPADAKGAEAALNAARAAEAQAAKARADAEAKLETLAAEAAAARARAQALADASAGAAARVRRLEAALADVEKQRAALQPSADDAARIDALRKQGDAAQSASNIARAALTELEGKLKAAEAADEAAWTPHRHAESVLQQLEAEVRALDKLTPAEGAKHPPVLAAIDVDAGYERALAAALGDDLDASTHAEAPAHWSGADTPKSALPAGAEPLAGFVKAPAALAARLALVGVVPAKDGARLQRQIGPGVRLVSREGDLWRWDGFARRADAPQPAAARLEHKARLAAARAELTSAEQKAARAKEAWEKARAARREIEEQARKLRAEAPKLAAKAADAVRDLERQEAEAKRRDERAADLARQAEALTAELAEAKAAAKTADAARAPTPGVDEAALSAARAAVDQARAAAADASAQAQAIARERAARDARRAAVAKEETEWRARAKAAAERIAALDAEAKALADARAKALAAPETARAALADLMDQSAAAEKRRAEAGDIVARAEAAARAAAEAARAAEHKNSAAREARAGAEAHAIAAEARLTDIAARAREDTGHAPEQLAAAAGNLMNGALGQASLGEIEKRFDRLKAEREAAGPVNLRAEEELAEAQQRLENLTKEKEDVAQGIAKLRGAITKLNNEGRARLMRAFEIVEAHFAQLFATLFEGGQATLKLTESEDPLDAGLEIYAEPPGKRLTHLSLLSGGEQALTATALVFAVFLANPAPLCVLDEVDAPLDDANVDRFCRLLEEMKRLTTTRFIVITHNPVTMSRMDRLYGVTMPEQGVSQLVSVDLGRAQQLAAAE
ncbi:MAG TPA: chromosome segregation protein SMC [Caulobacterales bacterium]|nr:chromosome segregation protein SMC [Caulobacterales bacterium]